MEKYTVTGRIGEGAHGVILFGLERSSSKEIALKKVLIRHREHSIPRQVIREIKTLQALEHNNVIQLLDHFIQDESIVLVFDFMPSGLYEMIYDDEHLLTEPQIKTYMKMTLSGVNHLHENRIMHRDLKPGNILISSDGTLKIGDFGLARPIWSNKFEGQPYTQQVATRWYRAPEILYGSQHYSEAIDMWAVGCIFAEMLKRKPLFPGETDIDQLALVVKNLGTPNSSNWPGLRSLPDYNKISFPPSQPVPWEVLLTGVNIKARQLVSSFIKYNAKKRATAQEALTHPYFFEDPLPEKESLMPRPAKDHRQQIRASTSLQMSDASSLFDEWFPQEDDDKPVISKLNSLFESSLQFD